LKAQHALCCPAWASNDSRACGCTRGLGRGGAATDCRHSGGCPTKSLTRAIAVEALLLQLFLLSRDVRHGSKRFVESVVRISERT
jgi:hypothetical protein